MRENLPQPVHPLARAERLQLRQEESDHGGGVRDGGRLAGQLRGEHERGHRADTADEAPDRLLGRNIYAYRAADGHARGPRQFGQKPVILRGDLSAEPGTDIPVHGRGAETGRGKDTGYRLGPVQRGHRDIQAGQDGLSGTHPAERGDGGAPAFTPDRRGGNSGGCSGALKLGILKNNNKHIYRQ